jgi:sugar phosphate isomerase/epimerase
LGVHYIEVNNTNRQIVETYDSRLSEFRDQMAQRRLTMLGFAVYSRMHITANRRELIDYHIRVGRFLKSIGGKYIAHLLAPAAHLGNSDDESYRSMDLKATVANADEVARCVAQETGIRMAYHAEQGDIRTGLYARLLESTDETYFGFLPDVGHFAACGVEPLGICERYRSRMLATHLRDVIPAPGPDAGGRPGRGKMVAFGTGTVDLSGLIAFLRKTTFTGAVMGEGGGNAAMRNYMAETLRIDFGSEPVRGAPALE